MLNILLISIGGFFGAICRFQLSQLMNKKQPKKIPVGTLFVNLTGSFLLGLLIGMDSSEHIKLLIGTGFMGAFTTFSTFNLEAISLLQSKAKSKGIIYICLTYSLGIILAFIGYSLGKM